MDLGAWLQLTYYCHEVLGSLGEYRVAQLNPSTGSILRAHVHTPTGSPLHHALIPSEQLCNVKATCLVPAKPLEALEAGWQGPAAHP